MAKKIGTRAKDRQKLENIAYPNGVKGTANQESLPNLMNEQPAVTNGLADAIGLGSFSPFGFPQNQSFPGSEQVSNADTLFKNLRWYFISNFRQVISQIYVEIGLVQTIVDVPVDDALRGGIEIKSKQLDEGQIKELQISMDRDDDINTVGQAAKWNRLFGGAGTIALIGDQDPEEPLDLPAIGLDTPLEFRAVDLWELFWDKQNTEGYDPSIQEHDFETYNYYGEQLHKSRVMRMKGVTAPSFVRPRLRGWGISVVETLVRSINQYLKATDLGFEVLDEFKLDVYKIKNLVNTLLSPNGEQKIRSRVHLANRQKNYQNAIVMDSEDDYDHKQLSFAGLAEAMAGIRMQVASDMRMPITKLFGTSVSSGMKTDQNDMENYNSMVESQVRNKIKYDLLRVCEIKCQKLFGFVPDDLEIFFKPLRELDAVDEETVKTQKFTRLLQAKQAGEITTLEFRDACNKGNLLDIQLDTSEDSINPDDPEIEDVLAGVKGDQDQLDVAQEGLQDMDESKDIDDPGANRADTQKVRKEKGAYGGTKLDPKKNDADADQIKAEIARLRDEAEKADDSNNHYKAESLREKARKLERELALKSPKKKNRLETLKPFTAIERMERVLKNSAAFDRASYAADGGDAWIDPRRAEFFENPGNVDEALWAKAKDASMKAFDKIKWQFVTWWYKKQGGKFS